MSTVILLVLAAVLEIGGDAAIRYGLARRGWIWAGVGAALLVLYGFVVNTRPAVPFNRLMGLYIALFFVVSQLISALAFGERPSLGLLAGGALIAGGGMVIVLTAK